MKAFRRAFPVVAIAALTAVILPRLCSITSVHRYRGRCDTSVRRPPPQKLPTLGASPSQ